MWMFLLALYLIIGFYIVWATRRFDNCRSCFWFDYSIGLILTPLITTGLCICKLFGTKK